MQGLPLPVTDIEGGQLTVGGWLSVTVTVIVHCLVRPAASVARNTTLLVPAGKAEPLAKPLTRIAVPGEGGQLSVNEGFVYVATAVHKSGAVFRAMLLGQVILGAWLSFTVTRKVQVLLLPAASVAFSVSVVMPFGKGWPLANPLTMATDPPAQLSVNVGVV